MDFQLLCSGRHGFVVAVTGIENVGKGLIRDGTGFVTFPVPMCWSSGHLRELRDPRSRCYHGEQGLYDSFVFRVI